jgi:hypothetical protein
MPNWCSNTITNESGSIYHCHKNTYGMSSLTSSILDQLSKASASGSNTTVEVNEKYVPV